MTHTWRWRKYLGERFGQPCRVVKAARNMDAALVEFEDGYRVITSRYAVLRIPAGRRLNETADG
jgi:hypothetical protein